MDDPATVALVARARELTQLATAEVDRWIPLKRAADEAKRACDDLQDERRRVVTTLCALHNITAKAVEDLIAGQEDAPMPIDRDGSPVETSPEPR